MIMHGPLLIQEYAEPFCSDGCNRPDIKAVGANPLLTVANRGFARLPERAACRSRELRACSGSGRPLHQGDLETLQMFSLSPAPNLICQKSPFASKTPRNRDAGGHLMTLLV